MIAPGSSRLNPTGENMTERQLSALLIPALTLVLAAPAVAMDAPGIPSLSNAQVTALNEGEVLVEVFRRGDEDNPEPPEGDAIGIINATPEAVFDVVRDFEHYPEFMEDIIEAEVLNEESTGPDSGTVTCRGLTDTPWPMEDRGWTIIAVGGRQMVDGVEVGLSTWTYVPGSGNIEDTTGYWLAMPWGENGEQTLLRYHLQVDLGTWLPDFILEWSTESFLPSKIVNIRERLGVD
jgi:hypothetical protein